MNRSDLGSLPPRLTVVFGERDRMLHDGPAADRLRDLAVNGRIELLLGQGHLVSRATYLHHLEQDA